MFLATSQDVISDKRKERNVLDEVASNIWQAPPPPVTAPMRIAETSVIVNTTKALKAARITPCARGVNVRPHT
jgi:hypothetical protein